MAIEAGTELGPYRTQEPLGAGGMGEVYLGEDTRLGRRVAAKVLPETLAADDSRLARFAQEARAAAALSHPHIAAVFDVGEEQGMHYMVQELLEGETLRDAVGPAMPLSRALVLGSEIAEALAAAHRAGIVHRDSQRIGQEDVSKKKELRYQIASDAAIDLRLLLRDIEAGTAAPVSCFGSGSDPDAAVPNPMGRGTLPGSSG